MTKVVVIGSSNTDMVVKTSRFPLPGETVFGTDFFMFPGGKGANQAVASARMKGDVTFICKIGNDIFGQQALQGFEKENINTKHVTIDQNHASGTAMILVNASGENEIVVTSGANALLSSDDVTLAEEAIQVSDIVLMQLETPIDTIVFAAKKCMNLRKKVILNPAPAQRLPEEIFDSLYLITPNETEAQILTGVRVKDVSTADQAATILLKNGVQNVIITLGSAGAYFKSKDQSFLTPAPKVNAIDTTAAGDVFNGVLAVELANGENWQDAIQQACKAASISVTRMGAQTSAPFLSEMNKKQTLP
jgi:ribokinase